MLLTVVGKEREIPELIVRKQVITHRLQKNKVLTPRNAFKLAEK